MAQNSLLLSYVVLMLLLLILLQDTAAIVLLAAGSGVANGLYTDAALAYSIAQLNVTVQYAGLGSGKGLCRIENATQKCAANDRATPLYIDFAASEGLLLSAQDYAEFPDLQMYPVVANAIVPIFNLGAFRNLTLSTRLLALIFRGVVTHWDDPRITDLNPGLAGSVPPGQPIQLVVRSDTAGATYVLKSALAGVDPAFAAQVGTGGTNLWPNVTVIAQSGNQGMMSYVMTTMYTLGYTDLGSANSNNLPVPVLMRTDNTTIAASLTSVEYAVLELGLSFGNNGDDPSRLTASLVNAKGAKAWPLVGYNYVVMRTNTLRPGATCDYVRETIAFWNWFLTSNVASRIATSENYCRLPQVVEDFVWARFVGDVRCQGQLVWASATPLEVPGVGTAVLSGFMGPVTEAYSMENDGVSVTYNPYANDDASTVQDTNLVAAAFEATTAAGLAAPPGGVALLFAGVGVVAVSPLNVTLSGTVLARILDGSITTWLDAAIVALNPGGILTAAGTRLSDPAARIRLLRGPIAASTEVDSLMQYYLPAYTGRAIRNATQASTETVLRSLVAGYPLALAVTPYVGNFPSGLFLAPLQRSDGAVVAPSPQAIGACAADTFDATDGSFSLQASRSALCYPLSKTVHIRVRRSRCDLTLDPMRTRAAAFVTWLFTAQSIPNALLAASLAPLMNATADAARINAAALSAISCVPAVQVSVAGGLDLGLVVGVVAGVGAAGVAVFAGLFWLQGHGRRNNSAAPKDERKPFCVLFTDIESSTHLWAAAPAEMAAALEIHHRLIRQLIAEHHLYEVKTIGDSFMCATPDPKRALAFAVQLQERFFQHRWDGTRAIDDAYATARSGGTLGKGPHVPRSRVASDDDPVVVWNGLRVRIGIHYGLGEIKLDPVSQGYDYYGTVVNTAARIESVCHGGQIGVSQQVYDAVGDDVPSTVWSDLGQHLLRGLVEPVHLYQVLPAGVLAQRTFPPLRLEKVSRLDLLEAEESCHSEDARSSTRDTQTTGPIGLHPERHPLVQRGDLTVAELQQQYATCMATLRTLLATQTATFTEATLKAICARLKVKYAGSTGARQLQTLHGLVMRILPGTVTITAVDRRASTASGVSGWSPNSPHRRRGFRVESQAFSDIEQPPSPGPPDDPGHSRRPPHWVAPQSGFNAPAPGAAV